MHLIGKNGLIYELTKSFNFDYKIKKYIKFTQLFHKMNKTLI